MKRLAVTLLATLLLAGGLVPSSASASRFKLGTQLAAHFMREALARHQNLSFQAGYARRVRCNKRVNNLRVRCRMSWIVGDLTFGGKGTIWITFPHHRPYWNYSYRVTRFNEYCAAVIEATDCTRTYEVR